MDTASKMKTQSTFSLKQTFIIGYNRRNGKLTVTLRLLCITMPVAITDLFASIANWYDNSYNYVLCRFLGLKMSETVFKKKKVHVQSNIVL